MIDLLNKFNVSLNKSIVRYREIKKRITLENEDSIIRLLLNNADNIIHMLVI